MPSLLDGQASVARLVDKAMKNGMKGIAVTDHGNMFGIKELKKIRIHREGTHILWASFLLLLLINAALYWGIDCKIPFYVVAVASISVYLLMVNFFRCPIRLFGQDTEKIVVAPADGKIVVIEEVDENEYFHDRRLMISIFMKFPL